MTADVVVVGLGNEYRTDDGVGPAAAAALAELGLADVRVVTGIADPTGLLEAWSGARLALVIDAVIDAAVATPSVPGRVRRCTLAELRGGDGLSSHGVDLVRAHELGRALERVPDEIVVLTVEVADVGHGHGLTPRVAAAVPAVVQRALSEIGA